MWCSLLHAITAAFHEVRDYRRKNRLSVEEKALHNGRAAPVVAGNGRY